MFAGRKQYIAKLNEFYEDKSVSVAVLMAPMGYGKSALLNKFVKDKGGIYFSAYPNTDFGMLVAFAGAMGNRKVKLPMDANLADPSKLESEFDKVPALQDMLDEISERAAKKEVLLVIDQYQNFIKADSTFEKILHDYITGEWKNLPIKVIFSGDSLLTMEKRLLDRKCIYKDCTPARIDLDAMTFAEIKKLFDGADCDDLVFIYGITGGIPAYVERVKSSVDLSADNVKKQAFMAMYFPENDRPIMPDDTMSIDLRELSYYNRILMTLAYGNNRVNQIAALVGKPKDIVVPYMKTLISIGIVEKENAITEKNNRKKTRYSIANTGYLFWYRYIMPNINLFYEGKSDELWKKVSGELDCFMKEAFIISCKTYLKKKADAGKAGFSVEEIGNWWENDEEAKTTSGFDFVSLGKSEGKHATVFSRCYYTDKPIEVLTLKDLIAVANHMPGEGETFFVVFSNSGFNENSKTVASAISNILLVSLEDVVSLA